MNIFLTSPISFPGLGIEGINPPDGFCIPGTNFEIKFYGVIIAIGVLRPDPGILLCQTHVHPGV